MEILNNRCFDLLVYIENCQGKLWNADEATSVMHIEKESIEKCYRILLEEEYINSEEVMKVTEKGYEYLEPYRVKRAVLLAAGFGSRMQPVTLETPKPLVNVNGKVIIETLIAALEDKGIEDITIVTGYLEEKFDGLKSKYPDIKFVHNGRYSEENNISSAILVKDLYGGAYVMDADLLLKNKDIIRKYEKYSNYLGIWVDETDDWRLEITDNRVTGMSQGGRDTYLMVGLSYWTQEDGKSFSEDIEALYSREEGKQMYWDDVVLTAFNEHYNIIARPCTLDDITEIDSIKELAEIDSSYKKYV